MDKTTFDILTAVATGKHSYTGNSAVLNICNKDTIFLSKDGSLTEVGIRALSSYKVTNAVIMAAGLSSRFVPLSFDKPKGLAVVKGEVLIERQIRQLQEAGIHEIYVVVGYMKELFFYLEEKFNVKLIINNEYALRNNNGSLWLVKDYTERILAYNIGISIHDINFAASIYRIMEESGELSSLPEINMKDPTEKFWV